MTPERLMNALEACASMLHTERGKYIVHRARVFSEGRHLRDETSVFLGEDLDRLLPVPDGVAAQAPLGERYPSLGVLLSHVRFIRGQIDTCFALESRKRYRWLGFAVGALAQRGRMGADNPVVDPRDMTIACEWAHSIVMAYHNQAHTMLGYLQGWLWTDGVKSIDEFRLMNNPNAKVPES